MSFKGNSNSDTYFAAANGYNGFRCYFDKVFNSQSFARIYVLKGGPGTGKSTFMKRIKSHFEGMVDVESILCSSDINSLDGIILTNGDIKCGVLDGTAPHERDALIPGAIDEIINLGEGWNSAELTLKKDIILSVNKQKKHLYSLAYRVLALAGEAQKSIDSILKPYINEAKLYALCERIFYSNPSKTHANTRTRLYSCFGKGGYQSLSNDSFYKIYLSGKHGSPYTVIKTLKRKYDYSSGIDLLVPSPLDDDMTEGFSVGNLFFRVGDNESSLNCSDIIDTISDEDGELIDMLNTTKNDLLNASSKYFKLAAEQHFMLENIYSTNMNFEKNTAKCNSTIVELEKILKI